MADVVIVGGGVIGLLSALELADRGVSPVVFEAPQRPSASWAGGGILSPLFPWRYSEATNHLCVGAVSRYQRLADRIQAAGGPDPEVTVTGMIAVTDDESSEVAAWCAQHGVNVEAIRARSRASFLPDTDAWWLPEMANLRNSRLIDGLHTLLQARGVQRRMAVVEALEPDRHGVTVKAGRETRTAERVLVAAGAWSGALLRQRGIELDISAVKGQMLLFDAPDVALQTMVLTERGYLIPRRDGHILVGSTLEPEPENMLPSRSANEYLHAVAAEIMPELGKRLPVAQWAGLRPGTTRPAPVLGQVSDNIWVATGHYRNGLVSAPASARLVAQLICGERPEIDPGPYSLSS